MAKINRSLAIIIGIDEYKNILQLHNARSDADQLANVLERIYGYKVLLLLDKGANKAELDKLVANLQNKTITFDGKDIKVNKSDRVLFYFAGHGFAEEAQDSEAGQPAGYFMPQDAQERDKNTWLSMHEVYEAFSALDCHHLLMILDCCFAGRISWVGQGRNAARSRKLYRQSYDRFIKHRTEQIITSAAHDEEAQDLSRFGQRGEKNGNSPFAHLLLKVLQGNSDGGRDKAIEAIIEDKIITVQELFTYLQNELGKVAEGQTPGLAQPRKYDPKTGEYVYLKGEYIFLLPKFNPENLTKLTLNKNTNPYKGLASFETEDSQLFYGRKTLSEELKKKVNKQPLTIVLGASGSGKSSLVKAGLIPTLKAEFDRQWHIFSPMRPGESPLKALNKILSPSESGSSIINLTSKKKINILSGKISYLITHNSESKLLLVIDQSEELVTLCKSQQERENFLNLLAELVTKYPQQIRIVLTLRSDFEPQLRDAIEEIYWQKAWQEGRFFVIPMDREELQQAIEEPAAQRTLFFESPKLVNQLIDEAIDTPGTLPLPVLWS
ncbi:MAG: caspase family protein [Pleurocapsa sp. MO_226.B13]|nr:caspase family protein [Pleurocapsa sp. MO_226.B13]